jgi:hypothetical protein
MSAIFIASGFEIAVDGSGSSTVPASNTAYAVNDSAFIDITHWNKVHLSGRCGKLTKNTSMRYAIYDGYTYYYFRRCNMSIISSESNKYETYMEHNVKVISTISDRTLTVLTIVRNTQNSDKDSRIVTSAITNNFVSNGKIDPETCHNSYGWGQAWLSLSTDKFIGAVGVDDYTALFSLIGIAAGALTTAIFVSVPFVAAAVAIIEAAVTAAWIEDSNEHISAQNTVTAYVEVGFSEGNWWDPWDTGAYAELGAYSN